MRTSQRLLLLGGVAGWAFPGTGLDMDFKHGRAALRGKAASLGPLLSNSNSTGGFVTWSDGHISSIGANLPRLSDLGLLCEQGSTNLVLQSQTFDNASWTKTRSSITTGSWTQPDNTVTGETLVEDNTASNTHLVSQTITKAASALAYTFTVYAKSSTRTRIALQLDDNAGNGAIAVFDLAGQQIGVAAAGVGTPFTSLSSSVTALPGGVTRCVLTATTNTATTIRPVIFLDNGSGTAALSNSYSGNGTSGAFIADAQVEQLAFATSYIKTTTVSVARSVDVVSISAAAFAAAFQAFPQSIYGRGLAPGQSLSAVIAGLHDGTANNRSQLRMSSANQATLLTTAASSTIASLAAAGTPAAGVSTAMAAAVASTDYAIARDGGTVATAATAGAMPSGLTTGMIGIEASNSNPWNQIIQRVAFFQRRLSNAQLQTLSAL